MSIIEKEAIYAMQRISKIPKGTRLSPEQVKNTEAQLERTAVARKTISDYFERKGIDPQSEKASKIDSELKTREIFLRLKLFHFDKARVEARRNAITRQLKGIQQEMSFIRRNEDVGGIDFNI